MILNIAQFFENELKKELKISHLEKKIDCKVVETSKVNKKMKDAIGKEEMKNGDILVGIVEMNAAPVEQPKEEEPKEEEPKDDAVEKEETAEVEANDADTSTDDAEKEGEGEEGKEENKEEEVKEEPKEEKKEEKEEPVEEEPKDDEEDDKKKKKEDKEELNESVKVQDLTASMLTPMKTVKPKKSCVKEGECSKKKKAKAKPSFMPVAPIDHEGEQGTPYAGGGEGGDVGGVEEAETEATGEELKVKVLKCL